MNIVVDSNNQKLRAKNDIDLRCKIRKALKSGTGHSHIRLPRDIWFEETDNGIRMSLSLAAIGKDTNKDKQKNMQKDSAAFEAWALVIHTYYLAPLNSIDSKKKIILGLQGNPDEMLNSNENKGHYNRFLYRAMRFTEEYKWMELDSELQKAVKIFRDDFNKRILINNEPDKITERQNPKETTNNQISESMVERQLIENEDLKKKLLCRAKINSDKLYRQLPVGLFREKVTNKNAFFTTNRSAIDLWSVDNENIAIFELKTDNNKIGIITELFFYSEFVYDIFIDRANMQNRDTDNTERGYNEIASDESLNKNLKAFFLANKFHPLLTDKVIDVMNSGKKCIEGKITYGKIEYKIIDNEVVL